MSKIENSYDKGINYLAKWLCLNFTTVFFFCNEIIESNQQCIKLHIESVDQHFNN